MMLQIVFYNTVREQQYYTDPCNSIMTVRVLTCGLKSGELLSVVQY